MIITSDCKALSGIAFKGMALQKVTINLFYGVNDMTKTIKNLIESDQIKALIALPGADFALAMETIKRKHFEGRGFKYLDPDNPATCEACE
jgi:hypothetical protein